MPGPESEGDPLLAAIAELRDEVERAVARPARPPAPAAPAPAPAPATGEAGDPWGRLDALARHLDGRLKRARGPSG